MALPATPTSSIQSSPLTFSGPPTGLTWSGFSSLSSSSRGTLPVASPLPLASPPSVASPPKTYLMPTSPAKARRLSSDGYRPRIARTTGQKPACLVNASVTYCGNNQIYAFGGFDQYTDEGKSLQSIPPRDAVADLIE